MKIKVEKQYTGRLFKDINEGEVFYDEHDPDTFLMRTDSDIWAAVDIELGALYSLEDFDLDEKLYHSVKAEVTIS